MKKLAIILVLVGVAGCVIDKGVKESYEQGVFDGGVLEYLEIAEEKDKFFKVRKETFKKNFTRYLEKSDFLNDPTKKVRGKKNPFNGFRYVKLSPECGMYLSSEHGELICNSWRWFLYGDPFEEWMSHFE